LAAARQQGKPYLHIARETVASVNEAGEQIAEFIAEHHVERLNIAGPRGSQEPEIAAFVTELLTSALAANVFANEE
jgi:hypothetical protein